MGHQKSIPKWSQNGSQKWSRRLPEDQRWREKPMLDSSLNFDPILNDFGTPNRTPNGVQNRSKTWQRENGKHVWLAGSNCERVYDLSGWKRKGSKGKAKESQRKAKEEQKEKQGEAKEQQRKSKGKANEKQTTSKEQRTGKQSKSPAKGKDKQKERQGKAKENKY